MTSKTRPRVRPSMARSSCWILLSAHPFTSCSKRRSTKVSEIAVHRVGPDRRQVLVHRLILPLPSLTEVVSRLQEAAMGLPVRHGQFLPPWNPGVVHFCVCRSVTVIMTKQQSQVVFFSYENIRLCVCLKYYLLDRYS